LVPLETLSRYGFGLPGVTVRRGKLNGERYLLARLAVRLRGRTDGFANPGLQRLITAMLEKNPIGRPTAGEVVLRLQQHLGASERRWSRRAWLAGTVAMVALLAPSIVLLQWRRNSDYPRLRKNSRPLADLIMKPLTSQPGWETDPAFSPDGKSIAFTWNARPESPQIYVKYLDKGEMVKITNSTTGWIGIPVWSPDARRIAFKRQVGSGGAIYTIPVTGGPESFASMEFGDFRSPPLYGRNACSRAPVI
jgi:hypothetical protein